MKTTFELMTIAAQATFRDMAGHDFDGFNSAPAGAQIADSHPDVLVIFVPAAANLDGDHDHLEFHGVDGAGEPWCVALDATRLL